MFSHEWSTCCRTWRGVSRLNIINERRSTYAFLECLGSLTLSENTGADEDTDGKTLRPHTGLHNLLCVGLVLVRHDDRTGDTHTNSPAADDDLVLVLHRPLLDLGPRGETLPVDLLLALYTLDFLHTCACPC